MYQSSLNPNVVKLHAEDSSEQHSLKKQRGSVLARLRFLLAFLLVMLLAWVRFDLYQFMGDAILGEITSETMNFFLFLQESFEDDLKSSQSSWESVELDTSLSASLPDPHPELPTLAPDQVAKKVLPSIVSIVAEDQEGGIAGGSGVVVNTERCVVTNYHVIENASRVGVYVQGALHPVHILGADPSSDLAVLWIEDPQVHLEPVVLGSSGSLEVGDWVMTLGSPFGLDQSVSQGIVSSLNRNTILKNAHQQTLHLNLIQVDAALNPGNSGGALVNNKGELVGIPTLYVSLSDSYSGVGFAIPIDEAMRSVQEIIDTGHVVHPSLGVYVRTSGENESPFETHKDTRGALVQQVISGSAAERAGLKEGDIITSLGDYSIVSAEAATLAVRTLHVGDTIPVTVERDGNALTLEVTLAGDTQFKGAASTANEDLTPSADERAIVRLIIQFLYVFL